MDFSALVTAVAHGNYAGLEHDSRQVRPGDIFVALSGQYDDGWRYAPEAVARGATLVVTDRPLSPQLPHVLVENPRQALAILAQAFHNEPSRRFRLTGVTGTNGKSTVTHLLEAIFAAADFTTGVSGTVYQKLGDQIQEAAMTTPDALALGRLFRAMADLGTAEVAMEVSSHALEQERVTGLAFDTAVLTNLRRDHLDYHHDLASYWRAKERLFHLLVESPKPNPTAVINSDDLTGAGLRLPSRLRIVTFGLAPAADVSATNMIFRGWTTSFRLRTPTGETTVHLGRPGRFNVENALAAAAVAFSRGLDLSVIRYGLETAGPLAGRCEVIIKKPYTVMIDFAHNPAGLEALLEMARNYTNSRVILVFGAEGGKDPGKRQGMGAVAGRLADLTILTSDNIHYEEPGRIAAQVAEGLRQSGGRYHLELDRRRAIEAALSSARPGDLVLIAGKGHERFQTVGDQKIPFEDGHVVTETLAGSTVSPVRPKSSL